MRSHRGTGSIAALLLALLLPLQGFAAASGCTAMHASGQSSAHLGAVAHEHCAHQPAHAPAAQRHGCCSACCMAAAALSPLDWQPPRTGVPELSLPALRAPLMLALDRLDRPP